MTITKSDKLAARRRHEARRQRRQMNEVIKAVDSGDESRIHRALVNAGLPEECLRSEQEMVEMKRDLDLLARPPHSGRVH